MKMALPAATRHRISLRAAARMLEPWFLFWSPLLIVVLLYENSRDARPALTFSFLCLGRALSLLYGRLRRLEDRIGGSPLGDGAPEPASVRVAEDRAGLAAPDTTVR